jgi:O-antigen ligase
MRNTVATPRNSWWGQAVQNRLVALVLAMIVIVPFIAVPADQHLGGMVAFVLEGFALVLAVALLWRARWNLSRDQIKTFLLTGPNAPVLLLTGLIVASCALAPNKVYGIQESLRWGAGILLFFVVAYQFRQSKHLFSLVDTILFLGIATSILSLGQYLLAPEMRGTTLFGNQQLLGSFLMILLPVAAAVALTEQASSEKTSLRQLAAQFATIMMAGCLLLAHSRSAWIGSLAGLAVLGALMVMTSAKVTNLRAQKHKLVLPAMLVLIAAGFGGLMIQQNSTLVDRASTLTAASQDGSLQQREQQLWHGTTQMIQQRPLSGWGIGQYPLLQRHYTDFGAQLSANGFTGVRTSLAEQTHNLYLQTAAELGFPGLALVIAVLVTFLVAGTRRVRQMDAGIRRSLLMASMAGVVGFSIDALSNPSWQLGQVSIFFWLMLGVGVSCLRPRARQAEEEALTVAPRVVRPMAVVAAFLALTLVVLPTASVSAAPNYNSHHHNRHIPKIALIVTFVLGLLYFSGAGGHGAVNEDEA